MSRKVLSLFVAAFLLGITIGAFADETVNSGEWNPSSLGPITTWTAPLCEKGKLTTQPFFFYNHTRGRFNDTGHYDALPEGEQKRQYQQQLFMQYGLTGRLEIDAQTIYQENFKKQDELKAHSEGLGDSYFFTRYCLWEEQRWLPQVTGIAQVKIPTGKYQHADSDKLGADLMGTGSWDPGFGVILTKKVKPFIFHADAIYSVPQEVKINGANTQYANYLNLDFAVEYFLPKGFNLMVEANGFMQGEQKEDGERSQDLDSRSLTVCPGIGWSNDTFQTLLAYQRIVAGKNTDANDSVVLSVVYTF